MRALAKPAVKKFSGATYHAENVSLIVLDLEQPSPRFSVFVPRVLCTRVLADLQRHLLLTAEFALPISPILLVLQ